MAFFVTPIIATLSLVDVGASLGAVGQAKGAAGQAKLLSKTERQTQLRIIISKITAAIGGVFLSIAGGIRGGLAISRGSLHGSASSVPSSIIPLFGLGGVLQGTEVYFRYQRIKRDKELLAKETWKESDLPAIKRALLLSRSQMRNIRSKCVIEQGGDKYPILDPAFVQAAKQAIRHDVTKSKMLSVCAITTATASATLLFVPITAPATLGAVGGAGFVALAITSVDYVRRKKWQKRHLPPPPHTSREAIKARYHEKKKLHELTKRKLKKMRKSALSRTPLHYTASKKAIFPKKKPGILPRSNRN